MIDWNQAQFFIQLSVYIGIMVGTAVYVYMRKKKGKDSPPELMQLLTGQQEAIIKWFWRVMEDGLITIDEAHELKELVGQGYNSVLNMIISLYGIKDEQLAVLQPLKPDEIPQVDENPQEEPQEEVVEEPT